MKKEIIQWYSGERHFNLEGRVASMPIEKNELKNVCNDLYHTHRLPLKSVLASDDRQETGTFRIWYVFGIPGENLFIVPYIEVQDGETFPSLVESIQETNWYERKIMTFFGLVPEGHPNPAPIILHEPWPKSTFPLRKEFLWNQMPEGDGGATYTFGTVEGEGIYEIPVGPVHAGIIEPGHFRFSVAGEEIVNLEPKLGYKHKGVEKLFEVLPIEKKIRLSESISGDSSFNHSFAFCESLESLTQTEVPRRAQYLRLIYAELERIANHLNDIGFIMLDTAFTFGGSQCARLREEVMRLNEQLTNHRFLRGVNVIGGVTKDIHESDREKVRVHLQSLHKDFSEVIEASERSSTMLNRLEGAGVLNPKVAKDHGIVGIAARALGISRDARVDYPYSAYKDLFVDVAQETASDVEARWRTRIKEVHASFQLMSRALEILPKGATRAEAVGELKQDSCALGITEGWRGDIVYFVKTNREGQIDRVDVRDPSFLNWAAFPYAVEENVVPDFPLVNKSFNLSYSGHDL